MQGAFSSPRLSAWLSKLNSWQMFGSLDNHVDCAAELDPALCEVRRRRRRAQRIREPSHMEVSRVTWPSQHLSVPRPLPFPTLPPPRPTRLRRVRRPFDAPSTPAHSPRPHTYARARTCGSFFLLTPHAHTRINFFHSSIAGPEAGLPSGAGTGRRARRCVGAPATPPGGAEGEMCVRFARRAWGRGGGRGRAGQISSAQLYKACEV